MLFRALVFTTAVFVLGTAARGHPSHANYDMTRYTHLEGRVQDILWINPHIWIFIEVAGDGGEPVQWSLETATPGQLARNGVSAAIVGSFLVAVGTGMPELVTSTIAAMRRESDLAVGNLVGSNLFNLLMVLPASALTSPIPVPRGA